MQILHDEPAEVFAILCLTTKYRVIAYHEVSRGTIDSTLVEPREVFTGALLAHAAAVIAVHVHPSGDRHHRPMISMSPDDSPRLAGCLAWNCWITSSSATGATAASGKWAAFDARGSCLLIRWKSRRHDAIAMWLGLFPRDRHASSQRC